VDHLKPWRHGVLPPRDERAVDYQVIILSDIGADSILLYETATSPHGPNRLKLIRDWTTTAAGS